jgi:hypothetical protein
MKLSDLQVNTFIDLYRQKTGETLTHETAHTEAVRFLRLIQVVELNAAKLNIECIIKKQNENK